MIKLTNLHYFQRPPAPPPTTGFAFATGRNIEGQLGIGDVTDRDVFTQIGPAPDWVFFNNSNTHVNSAYAINNEGRLFVTGLNSSGELGFSTPTSVNILTATTELPNNWRWKEISASRNSASSSQNFSIGLTTTGQLFSTGYNGFGQLALGDSVNRSAYTQIVFNAARDNNWIAVSSGTDWAMGLQSDNTVWSWGDGNVFRTGLNTTDNFNSPQQMFTDAAKTNPLFSTQIFAGENFGINLGTGGAIGSWGSNASGRTGQGQTGGTTNLPTEIGILTNWVSIATYFRGGFAVNSDSNLFGWGANDVNQLGIGNTINQSTPQEIDNTVNWEGVLLAGGFDFTIAYTPSDRILRGWGQNGQDQLGAGPGAPALAAVPKDIETDIDILSVGAGTASSYFVGLGGTVPPIIPRPFFAWGQNIYGQLGDGTTDDISTPTITDAAPIIVLKRGPSSVGTSIITEKLGVISGTGRNSAFELSISNNTSPITTFTPTTSTEVTRLLSATSGGTYSLIVGNDGKVFASGQNNNGSLGLGGTITSAAEFTHAPTTEAIQLVASSYNRGAAKCETVLYFSGLAFDGSPTKNFSFYEINDLPSWQNGFEPHFSGLWRDVALGRSHAVFLDTDGNVGTVSSNNDSGEAAANQELKFPAPITRVATDVAAIAGSDFNTYIYKTGTNGGIFGCGRSKFGTLGPTASLPTKVQDFILVDSDTDWMRLEAGRRFLVGMKADGSLWFIGTWDYGERGNGTTSGIITEFEQIGLNKYIDFCVSGHSIYAVVA